MGGNLVTWRSKKQDVVAHLSAEAMYRAMAHTACELIWIQSLLSRMGVAFSQSMVINYNNQAAVYIAKNLEFHEGATY